MSFERSLSSWWLALDSQDKHELKNLKLNTLLNLRKLKSFGTFLETQNFMSLGSGLTNYAF